MYTDKFAASKHAHKILGWPKIEINMMLSRLAMLNTYFTLGTYMYIIWFAFYQGLIKYFQLYPFLEYLGLLIVVTNYIVLLVLIYSSWVV